MDISKIKIPALKRLADGVIVAYNEFAAKATAEFAVVDMAIDSVVAEAEEAVAAVVRRGRRSKAEIEAAAAAAIETEADKAEE